MSCGCKSLAKVGSTEAARTNGAYSGLTHFYGVGSVLLGASLPLVLYYASDKKTLTQTDRYVLKGLAVASGLVIAPIGISYLRSLSK